MSADRFDLEAARVIAEAAHAPALEHLAALDRIRAQPPGATTAMLLASEEAAECEALARAAILLPAALAEVERLRDILDDLRYEANTRD